MMFITAVCLLVPFDKRIPVRHLVYLIFPFHLFSPSLFRDFLKIDEVHRCDLTGRNRQSCQNVFDTSSIVLSVTVVLHVVFVFCCFRLPLTILCLFQHSFLIICV